MAELKLGGNRSTGVTRNRNINTPAITQQNQSRFTPEKELRAITPTPNSAFGDFLVDLGEQGMTYSEEMAIENERVIAQQEEVELKARKKEDSAQLDEMSSQVNTREKDKFVRYSSDSAKFLQAKLAALDKETGMSDTFKYKYKAQLEGDLATHTSSVKKTIKDLTTSQHISDVGDDYESIAADHAMDMPARLRQNNRLYLENLTSLGETKSKELKAQADKDAVLSSSNRFLALGDTAQARRALEDPLVRGILGTEGRRAQIKAIADVEFSTAVSAGIRKKTNAKENYIDRGKLGLFNVALDKIVPGSDDPTASVLKVTGVGAFERKPGPDGNPGKWTMIEGTAPAKTTPESTEDKMAAREKFLVDHSIPMTPEILKDIAGLTPEALTALEVNMKLIEDLAGVSEADKLEMKQYALGKPKRTAIEEKTANFAKMLEEDRISEEMYKKAIIGINSGGKDIRSAKEIAKEKGESEAIEQKSKADKLKELGFQEPWVVGSNESNSIRAAVLTASGVVAKDGVQIPIPGTEDIVLEISAAAEDILIAGRANTINAASYLAWSEFTGDKPQNITPGSQIDRMIADADPDVNADRIAATQKQIEEARDNAAAVVDLSELESKLASLELRRESFKSDLEFKKATGVVSAFQTMLGSTLAQLPGLGALENDEVTKARLMFSLIARDVVRMIALSPRFAVTEQVLIQSIFSGPKIFLSALQAKNKTIVMREVLDSRINKLRNDAAITNLNAEKGQALVAEASQLLEIKARMNQFKIDIIDVKSAHAVRKLSDAEFNKYNGAITLGDLEDMPDALVIALNKRRKAIKLKRKNK